jgi:hypothetical protein
MAGRLRHFPKRGFYPDREIIFNLFLKIPASGGYFCSCYNIYMFEVFFKIWYIIAILPCYIAGEGWRMLKKFMKKHGYELDWAYTLLAILVFALIIILILEYGYQ